MRTQFAGLIAMAIGAWIAREVLVSKYGAHRRLQIKATREEINVDGDSVEHMRDMLHETLSQVQHLDRKNTNGPAPDTRPESERQAPQEDAKIIRLEDRAR